MAEMKIGEISKPRFEFRTFGQDFGEAAHLMARLSMPVPKKVWERTSDEIYIMSRTNDANNTKLRDGKMDIKTFVTEHTVDEFLAMIEAHPDLQAVKVHKHRFGYMVNDTICEVADVLINGAKVVTINSESTELADITKTLADVGLVGIENINYLQAIKRVIGWIDKDLAN